MRKILFFFLSSVTLLNANILDQYISKKDQRYPTFKCALELLQQRNAHTIVETGTARRGRQNCVGDGCSSVIFSRWANENHAEFYSVDIDPKAIKIAKRACRAFQNPNLHFICSDSTEFLKTFEGCIDFLYLDSYDFEVDNPLPSQIHHLKEIKAAYPHLTDESIVLIDDCNLPHGGKGKLVIEFLMDKGWQILYRGYQVLMVKKTSILE